MLFRSRILFLVTSLYGGGAERVCCILANEMAKKYDVGIVTVFDSGGEYPLDPSIKRYFVPWGVTDKFDIYHRLRRLAGRIRAFRRIKKEFRPDISIAFLRPMCQINALSRYHDRIVSCERANPLKFETEAFPLTKRIYAISDCVVFQSETVRSIFGKRVRDRSVILPNPVNVPVTASAERKKRIVTMGRLVEQKNHMMLLEAFAGFRRDHPDYTLSIYGEGELRGKLEERIRALGLEGLAILEGNHTDVHERIRDAEFFVLSSDFEGLSNALLEAMMMGIAVISTRCEGSSDVVKDMENGILVDIGDTKGLETAMRKMADDAALRKSMEERCLKDSEIFRTENAVRQWEKMIDDVCSGKNIRL